MGQVHNGGQVREPTFQIPQPLLGQADKGGRERECVHRVHGTLVARLRDPLTISDLRW